MGADLGKVVRNVAIGIGVAVAAVATGGLAIAAGATILGAAAAAATIGLVGVQYLMRPSGASAFGSNLPMMQAQPSGPPPTPLRKTLRQADVPRCFIFGRTKTSGAYFFYETDTAKNLYQGIYMCDGPIDGFDAVLCDDEAFSPGSTGSGRRSAATDGSPNVYIPIDGIKFIKASYTPGTAGEWKWEYGYKDGTWKWDWFWHDGTAAVAHAIKDCAGIAYEPVNATDAGYNSYILNTLMVTSGYSIDGDSSTAGFQSNLSGIWSSAHLGKGITCLYTYASTNVYGNANRIKYFPNAWPEWSVIVRGARMYDPRKDSTNGGSGAHRITEGGAWTLYNSTWAFSENPAIIAAHYIMWLVSKKRTAILGVDWPSIIAAANDCDALVSARKNNYGSTYIYEPFARISAVFYFNTPPREFLSNIMASCDGSYGIDKDGKFTMWVGKWEAPAITFTENDISSFTEEFLEPATETVNEIHITYNEARQGYQRFEAPVYSDTSSQSAVGIKSTTINFDMVPSSSQAYRLAARFAKRINGKRKLTVTVGPRGMLAIKQRVVDISAPNYGITQTSGVAWRVESLTPEMTLAKWTLTLREIDGSVFSDPVPSDPIGSLKVVNLKALTAPQYLIITSNVTSSSQRTIYVSADTNSNAPATAIPSINELAMLQEQTLMLYAEYSLNGGGTWTQFDAVVSNSVVYKAGLNRSTVTSVRARFVGLNGETSAWSATQTFNSE